MIIRTAFADGIISHQAVIDVVKIQRKMDCTQAEHEARNGKHGSFGGVHSRCPPYKYSNAGKEQNSIDS